MTELVIFLLVAVTTLWGLRQRARLPRAAHGPWIAQRAAGASCGPDRLTIVVRID